MPKLPVIISETNARDVRPLRSGGFNSRNVGNPGAALQGLGAALDDVADVMIERQTRQEITEARARFSDAQLEFDQHLQEKQNAAELGAPNHFEDTRAELDEYLEKFRGDNNARQNEALMAEMAAYRKRTLNQQVAFQAKANVDKAKIDLGRMVSNNASAIGDGRLSYGEGLQSTIDAIEGSNLPAAQREVLKDSAKESMKTARTQGLMRRDPIELLSQVDSMDFLSEEEKSELKDSANKRIASMEKDAELQRQVDFIRNNQDVYNRFLSENGSGNALTVEQLDGMKEQLPPEMYKSMRKDLESRFDTVSEPTFEEKSKAFDQMFAEFQDLAINRDGETDASLRQLLDFQEKVSGMVRDKLITRSEARRFMERSSKPLLTMVDEEGGSGPLDRLLDSWGGEIDVEDRGLDVIANNFDETQTVMKRDAISNYFDLMETTNFDSITDKAKKVAKINELAQQAIRMAAENETPSLRLMPDAPNAVLKPDGTVQNVLPGQRNLKANETVKADFEIKVGRDGNRYKVFKDGRVERVQ